MSINHSNPKTFFSTYLIPTTAAALWANTTTAAASGNGAMLPEEPVTNIRGDIEQEKLFEKPLTPSDVGKLNRLVIPKQHAEKYFPLHGGGGGGGGSASDSGEKRLLLGFEDEGGKPWRFRYSYWNSSQSYVLTKGWSRFVKEKRLDAGDVVLFTRHRMDFGRFFIGWRRRNGGKESGAAVGGGGRWSGAAVGGGGRRSGAVYSSGQSYPKQHQGTSSVAYRTDHCSTASGISSVERLNGSSNIRGGVHVCVGDQEQTRRSGNWKRMRLFGVNLEWPEDESEASTTAAEGSATSSHSESTHHQSCNTDHHRTWI